jgi:hypothetical protein
MKLRTSLLVWCVLVLGAALSGCTVRHVLDVQDVVIGQIRVNSKPAAEVWLNGSRLGDSPIQVPVHRQRTRIQVTSKNPSGLIFIAALTGVLLPPLAMMTVPAVLNIGMDSGAGIQTSTHQEVAWEERHGTVELRRAGFQGQTLRFSSKSYPPTWEPTLVVVKKPLGSEKEAEQAQRKLGQEARNLGEKTRSLNRIVEDAVKLQEELLKKPW